MVVPSDIHSLHNNESFPMALFKNITFDDTADIFAYSVIEPEIWTNYNPTSPELYYNHTLHWLLFNQTQGESLGSIEFVSSSHNLGIGFEIDHVWPDFSSASENSVLLWCITFPSVLNMYRRLYVEQCNNSFRKPERQWIGERIVVEAAC